MKTDQTGQADVSLRWALMSFCWVCRAAAQFSFITISSSSSVIYYCGRHHC